MEVQDDDDSDDQFENAYQQSKQDMSDRKHAKKHKSKKRQRHDDIGQQDRVNKFFEDEAEEALILVKRELWKNHVQGSVLLQGAAAKEDQRLCPKGC